MPSSTEVTERALGPAYGLGTLPAIIATRPFHVSAALPSKVFDTTTQLLRNAGEHSKSVTSVDEWIFLKLRLRADALGSTVTLFAGPYSGGSALRSERERECGRGRGCGCGERKCTHSVAENNEADDAGTSVGVGRVQANIPPFSEDIPIIRPHTRGVGG